MTMNDHRNRDRPETEMSISLYTNASNNKGEAT